jgi:hypothetical protein
MNPKDYLIKNKLAIEIDNTINLVASENIPTDAEKVGDYDFFISDCQCKIYLCTLIKYLHKYNLTNIIC